MTALPDSGQLSETPLPRLLLDLLRARFGGTLHLERERTSKRFAFQDGAPVYAESNLASESLGVLLLDRGRISREDYAEVTRRVQEQGTREGAALLQLKLLEPRELFLALKDQVRRRLLECFGWPDGAFRLDPEAAAPEDAQAFRSDTLRLVYDGISNHWGPERLLAQLGDTLMRRPVLGDDAERVRKRVAGDDGVERFFAALDGARTLGEVVHGCGSPHGPAVAWLLDAVGALEEPEREAEAAPASESAPDVEIVFSDAGRIGPRRVGAAGDDRGDESAASRRALDDLRQEVLERHGQLGELDHYGILDLTRDADTNAVKRSYFASAKRYHPDALASLGLGDLRREANEVFGRIAKAYATLSDPERRREYDAGLDGAVAADANRLANAESLYRKGEILLRKGDFAGALQYLAPAVELWPEDPAYQCALGWALHKKAPPRDEVARKHLEKALALDPKDPKAHLRLGMVLKALGDGAGAKKATAKAKQLDPKVDPR